MRIIAGKFKGRKLKSYQTDKVRPTKDMVKEAIFNILLDFPQGKDCLDLFAGFGNLGLEAASRGAATIDFVEIASRNCKIIGDNIGLLGIENKTELFCQDVKSFIRSSNKKYDLVFIDPPYDEGYYTDTLNALLENQILKNPALLIIEFRENYRPVIPKELVIIKEKSYGSTGIIIAEFQG
ncbi:MAG: 16S rRNA (guanine(966)-N(2))-methyltransferase RsmD [Halanaerobiaceae bacterium]